MSNKELEEWRNLTFGEVLHEREERGVEGDQLLSVTNERGVIRQEESNKRDTSSRDKSKYKKVFPKDIVYNSMRMWQGVSGRSNFEGIVSPAYIVCTPSPGYDSLFIAYLIKHPLYVGLFRRHSQGLVDDTLTIKYKTFAKLPVSIPSNELEQRRIASALDTLDETIAATEALVAKLTLMRHGLLHDLLTRGLDEHGELRDPERHPKQFRESEVGRVPRDWEVVKLKEVVPKAEYGISVSLHSDGTIPVLRMNNLKNGEADISELKFSDSKEARALLLRPLDVLFNRTNSIEHVGRTGIWRGQLEQASFASYLVRLVPDLNRLYPEYLNQWLNLPQTQKSIKRLATPAIQQVNINPTNLRKVQMPLPKSIDEQRAIIKVVHLHNARLRDEEAYLAKLRQIKRGLMDDLLTGRVRVPLAETAEALDTNS